MNAEILKDNEKIINGLSDTIDRFVEVITAQSAEIAGFKATISLANLGIDQLKEDHAAEIAGLREFACAIIRQECWGVDALDGCEIQDLAERLGLIVPHIATAEDVGDEDDYEVGDKIYVFSAALKEREKKT